MITMNKMARLARRGCVALPFLVTSTGALADVSVDVTDSDVEFNFMPVGPGPVIPPDPLYSIRAGVTTGDGQLDISNGEVVEMDSGAAFGFGEPFFIIGRTPTFKGTMSLDNAALIVCGSDVVEDGGVGGQVGRTTEGWLMMSNGASLIVNNPDGAMGADPNGGGCDDPGDHRPGAPGSGLGVGRSLSDDGTVRGDGHVELSGGSTVQLLGEASNLQIGRDGGVGEVNVTEGSSVVIDDSGPVDPNGGGTLNVGRSLEANALETTLSTMMVDGSTLAVSSVNHAARIFVAREGTAGALMLSNGADATVHHTGPLGDGDAGVVLGDGNVVLSDGSGAMATMTIDDATLSVSSDNDAARIWLGRDDPATSGELSVSGDAAEITVRGGTTSSVTVGTEGQGMLTMDADARLIVEGNGDLQVARQAGAVGVVEFRDGAEVEIGEVDGDVFVATDFSSFGFSEGGNGSLLVDGASLVLDASAGVDQSADLICGSPQSFVGSTGSPTGTVVVTNGGVIQADVVLIGTGCTLGGDGIVDAQVVADGGTVAPGTSISTLTVADLMLDGGLLEIEVGGDGPGEADHVDVLGGADLSGGTILFKFVDGYLPTRGDRISFLSASDISGFETVAVDYEEVGPGFKLNLEDDLQGGLSFVALNRARPVPPACERSGERPPWC